MSQKSQPRVGRYSYEGLDRLFHEKARLGILTSLSARPDGVLFNELKDLCALTDGNLSRHIQVLVDGGLIEARKGRGGGRSVTLYRLSARGRRRFLGYLGELERVLGDARTDRDEARDRRARRADGDEEWQPV